MVRTNGTNNIQSRRHANNSKSTYLVMETRKATMVTTSTKISTILHFANASSHKSQDPRFVTETLLVGANQSPIVMSCFEYGQTNENKKIIMASSRPPAAIQQSKTM